MTATARIELAGCELQADLSGALVWPDARLAAVADLHLEKASGFARRGSLLPPYDTADTLERLAQTLRRHRVRRVLCLGDSFHDGQGIGRLGPREAETLERLVGEHEWVWLAGNHDAGLTCRWGGRVVEELAIGPLCFRHEAREGRPAGEISGHYHPKAVIRTEHRRLSARCFVSDERRLVLPAFGSFTGGLNVRDSAIARLFPNGFRAHVLGPARLHVFPHHRLAPDVGVPPRRQGGDACGRR